jgi:hypothetical protein
MIGRAGRLSGFGGRVVGFIGLQMGFFGFFFGLQVNFKHSAHIIILDFLGLFWAILKPNQPLYVIGPINLIFLAIFLLLSLLIC